jgi:two-component system chemotaxis response regulator CheY
MSKKVIYIDDSKSALAYAELATEGLVKSQKIEFTTYLEPLKLIEDIKSKKVACDMLLVDINMPDINGFDLTRELKSIASMKQKPIIALTTEKTTAMKLKGKEVGIAGWINKPFEDERIVSVIKKILAI